MGRQLGGGGSWEWYTPGYIVERARAALGGTIDLDPASSAAANRVVRARRYFTRHCDGLAATADWTAAAVFLNPPYSGPLIRRFADRLLEELAHGRVDRAVWLSNANVGAAAGQAMLAAARRVCFWRGRVRFVDGYSGEVGRRNRNDSMILALGNVDLALFDGAFSPYGVLL